MPDNKFKNTDTRPSTAQWLHESSSVLHWSAFTAMLFIIAAVIRKTHTVCIRTVTKLVLYDNHDRYSVVESIAEDYV